METTRECWRAGRLKGFGGSSFLNLPHRLPDAWKISVNTSGGERLSTKATLSISRCRTGSRHRCPGCSSRSSSTRRCSLCTLVLCRRPCRRSRARLARPPGDLGQGGRDLADVRSPLLETAGLTWIRANEPPPGIGNWMDAIRAAARTIEVAPGHPLDRLLFMSRTDWDRRRAHARVSGGGAELRGGPCAARVPVLSGTPRGREVSPGKQKTRRA